MPGWNGAVNCGPAPPIAHTLPVLSPRSSEDAAHLSDGRVPATLTQRSPDADPPIEPAGPAGDSAGAGQLPAPVRAPDR